MGSSLPNFDMNNMLTEENFLQYAMKHYDNPQCTNIEEFEEDLKRFVYLRKLFARYQENNDLKERLILNHIIVLYNLFGDMATEMLYFKMDKTCWKYLNTFLIYLNRAPDDYLDVDVNVVEVLRKI